MNLHNSINELVGRRNELLKRVKAIDGVLILVGLLSEKVKEVEESESLGIVEITQP